MNSTKYFNRDFKALRKRPRVPRRHLHLFVLALSGIVGAAALVSPTDEAVAERPTSPGEQLVTATLVDRFTIPLEPSSATPPLEQTTADDLEWQSAEVRPGDSLSSIFRRLDIPAALMFRVLAASDEAAQALKRLMPGQRLEFGFAAGELKALHYTIDETKTLVISRADTSEPFSSRLEAQVVETRVNYAGGTIESSLYAAGREAGLTDRLIMELVAIFGWDVDFALDIRRGDSFFLIYEEQYVRGEHLREGAILAAEFINNGKRHRAVRFTTPEGVSNYYDPEGRSMRKAFIRSPVDFRRISSRFQPERWHPVLGERRPHRGVDYAAPVGTPIKAAGDGRIIQQGWNGGYGRVVILQHGGNITTLYAHMSRFRPGLGVGSRVRQGQIIGYVGQSGLATGPHLHYEFRVNGVHQNPLTVRLPQADPIAAEHREAFERHAAGLLSQLEVVSSTRLATAGQLR